MAEGTRARIRKKHVSVEDRFLRLVCTAVAEMSKAKGASRQSIVRFVQETQQENVSNEVNRALRSAVAKGLLVHSTGNGLNGSFILGQGNFNVPPSTGSESNCKLQFANWGTIQSREAKIRKLSTIAGEETVLKAVVKGNGNCSFVNTNTLPKKRQRKSKLSQPTCTCEANENIPPDEKTSTAMLTCVPSTSSFLQSILKKTKWKRTNLRKSLGLGRSPSMKARKVRFARSPRVVFISPRVRRIGNRKRRQSVAL